MQFLLAFQIIANEPDAPSLSLPLQMHHCHLQAESGRAAPADATQKRSLLQKFLLVWVFLFFVGKACSEDKVFFFPSNIHATVFVFSAEAFGSPV